MAATIKGKDKGKKARAVPHSAFAVSANRVHGRNFVIKIQLATGFCTEAPTRDQVLALEKWVVAAIDSLHVGDTGEKFGDAGWQAAQRTVFDWGRGSACNSVAEASEWKIEEDEETPCVYALCHFYWQGGTIASSPDGMTIMNEHVVEEVLCNGPLNHPSMTGALLLTHPDEEVAAMITRVGVSGVSDQLMMEQWWGTVGPEFDNGAAPTDRWGFRTGYMVHSQWTAPGCCVREQSYNFGWRGYADVRKFNPEVLVWA